MMFSEKEWVVLLRPKVCWYITVYPFWRYGHVIQRDTDPQICEAMDLVKILGRMCHKWFEWKDAENCYNGMFRLKQSLPTLTCWDNSIKTNVVVVIENFINNNLNGLFLTNSQMTSGWKTIARENNCRVNLQPEVHGILWDGVITYINIW